MTKSYVLSTAKGRQMLAAAIRQELDVRGWTQQQTAEKAGRLSQATLSKFLRQDNTEPYDATLSALDATFGWETGFSRSTITWRQKNGPAEEPAAEETDVPDPVVTGDPDLDAELRAIIDIRFILDSLEYPAQRRVIHWAAERYGA